MTTTTHLDFEEYAKNLDSLAKLREEIERLEGFEELTASQERRLSALQGSFSRIDEARKTHERACLVARVNFDGKSELYSTSGHTPAAELDE